MHYKSFLAVVHVSIYSSHHVIIIEKQGREGDGRAVLNMSKSNDILIQSTAGNLCGEKSKGLRKGQTKEALNHAFRLVVVTLCKVQRGVVFVTPLHFFWKCY